MKPLLLLALLSAPAAAAPSFNKEAGVRLSSAALQAFTGAYADAGGGVRAFYIRESSMVVSARSADGLAFTDEPGVRLSSLTVPALDIAVSSITGLSVLPLDGGGFRMAYSVAGTTGAFRIYTATSADGLAWANDTGTAVNVPGSFVGLPSLVELGGGDWRLYYLQDLDGGDDPADYRVFSALSTNEGRNFGAGSQVLTGEAGGAAAALRTDGRVRLFYTAPLTGETTRSLVLSALSSDSSGLVFSNEIGVRLSTPSSTGSLSHPFVARTTDTFRWRLYSTFTLPAKSTGDVYGASSDAPDPASLTPSLVFQDNSGITLTVAGEVFSPGATALLRRGGQPDIVGGALTYTDDQTIAFPFNTQGQELGLWDLVVTNASGLSTTLSSALLIDFKGGSVVATDNLLRPLQGGSTRLDVNLFAPGKLSLKVYTLRGDFVNTVFEGEAPAGTSTYSWNGRTASGSVVASGVYLLHAAGPKLDLKAKIVVIK